LHVAQISFFTDPDRRAPAQLLRDWPSLSDVAECAARSVKRVSVIQASHHSEHLQAGDVEYYFLPFGRGHPGVGHDGGFGRLLQRLAPDVLHVHGLHFAHDVQLLAALLPGVPILLQDHASRPPRPWRRATWRRGFCAASGIAFCSREQARPFEAARLIAANTKIYAIPESTSRFAPGDREQARRLMRVGGEPLVLSVGHLDGNKDPLTVLGGISRAAQSLPALTLYCCYGTAPLLKVVRHRIAADPHLRGRVHLLGRLPHEQIEQMMRAADVYVSGSHREGSGYSVIEALACGLPTVVTDIPSFRTLTGADSGGPTGADSVGPAGADSGEFTGTTSVGALWRRGDAIGLSDALLNVVARPQAQTRTAARRHFEAELSFDAVGRKLGKAYRELLQHRPGRPAPGLKHNELLPHRA
jgi:glycosyltransferase involved in cell wall biosynthesis